jgi:hypothetical protein
MQLYGFLSAAELCPLILQSLELPAASTCSEKIRVSYAKEFKLFADLMSNLDSRWFNIRWTKECM